MKSARSFLLAATAALALFSASASEAQEGRSAPAARRNIVFVLLDDLRYDGMGFLQPNLRTPNIDRMAREGTYFPNAYVTSSLCSPSRATILTGRTTRNHRIVDNNDTSEGGLVFFPRYLQEAGYETAFIGKWHMGASSDAPRPGFDKWVSFTGQGNYFPTDGLTPRQIAGGARQMLNIDGEQHQQRGYITDDLTDYALRWLERERDQDKPFFLYLSHKAVHSDAMPAPRHRNQYARAAFALPQSATNTPENYAGKPMWVFNQRNSWHGVDFMYHQDRPVTDYMRDYYGALSAVDDSLGRIMAYLRQRGLAENTLVVFSSDNGFMFGEHGLVDKRAAYEASVRVPLLIWAPGLVPAGRVNPGRVRNLDLAPTFLEVAGAPAPAQFEGVSVLPLASGAVAPSEWRPPDFVYEYYWEWTFPMTPTTFAIVRNGMKYVQYHGIWDLEELYDLSADPNEMHNLIDDPAHVQTKIALRQALYEGLADNAGRRNVPFTARTSRGMVRRERAGAGAAPFPDQWLVEPNRADRFTDVLTDSPAKAESEREGRPSTTQQHR